MILIFSNLYDINLNLKLALYCHFHIFKLVRNNHFMLIPSLVDFFDGSNCTVLILIHILRVNFRNLLFLKYYFFQCL